MPQEEALEKITKNLNEMKISFGNENNDFIAIMCIHRGKQWSIWAFESPLTAKILTIKVLKLKYYIINKIFSQRTIYIKMT